MKNKLGILLALTALVFPAVAGCNKGNRYQVSVDIVKAEGDSNDFIATDCARVTGTGNYNEGSDATINVELANGCYVDSFIEKGGSGDTSGTPVNLRSNSYTVNVNSNKYYELSIKMTPNVIESGVTINFDGIYTVNDSRERTKVTSSTWFPNSQNATPTKLVNTSEDKKLGQDANGSLSNIIVDNYFNKDASNASPKIDLNYIFTGSTQDTASLVPNKLVWQIGKYNPSVAGSANKCDYTKPTGFNQNDITQNLSTIVATLGKNLCITAEASTSNSESKTKGLQTLKLSEMFVSKGDACFASNRDPLVSGVTTDCYYVSHASNLSESATLGTNESYKTSYYAYIDEGNGKKNIEGIGLIGNTIKYLTCANSLESAINNCQSARVATVASSDLSKIQISQYINDLSATGLSVTKWEYNVKLHDTAPVEITANGRTYKFKYLGDGITLAMYNPSSGIKFINLNAATDNAKIVDLKIYNGNTLDTNIPAAVTEYYSKLYHNVVPTGSDADSTIRQKLYELYSRQINDKYFVLESSGGNLTGKVSYYDIIDKYGNDEHRLIKFNNKICSINDANCFNESYDGIQNIFKSLVNKPTADYLKSINIVDVRYAVVDNDQDVLIYYVKIGDNTYILNYNLATKEVSVDNKSIVLNVGDDVSDFSYHEITTFIEGDIPGKKVLSYDKKVTSLKYSDTLDVVQLVAESDNKFVINVANVDYTCTISSVLENVTCVDGSSNPLENSPYAIIENGGHLEFAIPAMSKTYTVEFSDDEYVDVNPHIMMYIKDSESHYVIVNVNTNSQGIIKADNILHTEGKLKWVGDSDSPIIILYDGEYYSIKTEVEGSHTDKKYVEIAGQKYFVDYND